MTKQSKSQPKQAQHLYATVSNCEDGTQVPWMLHGSMKEAKGFGGSHYTQRRFSFVPLVQARRFRGVIAKWAPAHGNARISDKEAWDAEFERWVAAVDTFPEPSSLIDVPEACQVSGVEYYYTQEEIHTRDEALERVSKENAKTLEEYGAAIRQDWWIVVELGEFAPGALPGSSVDVWDNGLGCESQTTYRPLRLVLPSAAELKQYPMPEGVLSQ